MSTISIVTGGSSGIGKEIVKKLLLNGHTVINFSRAKVDFVESYKTDVRDPDSIRRSFVRVLREYGVPGVLVNCAGFVDPKGIFEMSVDNWDKTISTNLTGAFLCTREFARCVRNTGGKIVNIASTAGTRPQPGWSAYAAAKAGLINFSLTMAEELRPYNIRVYCIAPGRCATKLRSILAPDEDPKRIMQPDELAEMISNLILYDNLLDGNLIIAARK
jgi:NAD(P)-dependent dehydrogenase (short-subunit alcohol dehydrogenase family)